MKKSLSSLFIAAIVSMTVVCVHAAEAVSEAVVINVKGGAQATLPGQSKSVEIKVGDKLPQGTVIQTPGNSEVEIQAFSGSTTTIKPGSKVDLSKLSLTTANGEITKQSALIDLTIGTVVSTLDPSKKAINDYAIRTPKGVAAARGTQYTVTVTGAGMVRVLVVTGVVRFTNSVTGQSVDVPAGFTVTIDADGKISEPVEASPEQQNAKSDEGASIQPVIDITIVSPSS